MATKKSSSGASKGGSGGSSGASSGGGGKGKGNITIKGKLRIDEVAQEMLKSAYQGTKEGAEAILQQANLMCPKDTGKLLSSGKVSAGAEGEYGISYTAPYAVRLHEHPEYNFQNGRQGKWLEKAVQQHSKECVNAIVNNIKKVK